MQPDHNGIKLKISNVKTAGGIRLCYHLIHIEKVFDEIQCSFMTKTLSKLEIEGSFPNLIKNIYKNLLLNLYLMVRNIVFFY